MGTNRLATRFPPAPGNVCGASASHGSILSIGHDRHDDPGPAGAMPAGPVLQETGREFSACSGCGSAVVELHPFHFPCRRVPGTTGSLSNGCISIHLQFNHPDQGVAELTAANHLISSILPIELLLILDIIYARQLDFSPGKILFLRLWKGVRTDADLLDLYR